MREAVRVAQENAKSGDVVLLSPGLSWLPVMNEFERGDAFTKWVKRLPYQETVREVLAGIEESRREIKEGKGKILRSLKDLR